jgi:hypothetical protein
MTDIDIKVRTPDQIFWDEIKTNSLKDIENLEKMLKFQRKILEMCDNELSLLE